MVHADRAFPTYRAELNRISGNPFSKSTFAPTKGIPGYMGFIDSTNSLLISDKPNTHVPLEFAPPALTLQGEALKSYEGTLRKATYTATYTAQPESYKGGSGPFGLGKPPGYANTQAAAEAAAASARGGEASTLGAGHGASAAGKSSTGGAAAGAPLGFRGYSGVESTYRGQYPMRAQTAPEWATRPPKQDIMFQTTYGNHYGVDSDVARVFRDERDPLGFRPMTATLPGAGATAASAGATQQQGRSVLGHPAAPRVRQFLEDATTHKEDFSLRPLDRNAPIRAGTVKQTNQVASYKGFVPSSKANEAALRHSFEPAAARTEAKEGVRLLSLDQYSRLRPGGYTGYRPKAPANAEVFDPPSANMSTTTGRAEFYGTVFKGQPAKSVGPNAGLAKQSMLSFFTPGKTAVSDNGITNAQRFYVGVRPNEGLPALYRAPSTTYYGKRFDPQGVSTFN